MKTIIAYSSDKIPKGYTGIVINSYSSVFYFKNAVLHRADSKPAVIWRDGVLEYYINGKQVIKEVAQAYADFFPEDREKDYNIESDINKIEDRRSRDDNESLNIRTILDRIYRGTGVDAIFLDDYRCNTFR